MFFVFVLVRRGIFYPLFLLINIFYLTLGKLKLYNMDKTITENQTETFEIASMTKPELVGLALELQYENNLLKKQLCKSRI